MKKIVVAFIVSLFFINAYSQDMTKFNLYKPDEKAEQEIAAAVKQAKSEGKNVLIQIGGNWCIWCARFHDIVSSDTKIDSIIKAGYVVYHLNYSKENYN